MLTLVNAIVIANLRFNLMPRPILSSLLTSIKPRLLDVDLGVPILSNQLPVLLIACRPSLTRSNSNPSLQHYPHSNLRLPHLFDHCQLYLRLIDLASRRWPHSDIDGSFQADSDHCLNFKTIQLLAHWRVEYGGINSPPLFCADWADPSWHWCHWFSRTDLSQSDVINFIELTLSRHDMSDQRADPSLIWVVSIF